MSIVLSIGDIPMQLRQPTSREQFAAKRVLALWAPAPSPGAAFVGATLGCL
jgi:hypothetical protein